jgi:hypothetical protein
MPGEGDTPTVAQPIYRLVTQMPLPGSTGAPLFVGEHLTTFLSTFERQAVQSGYKVEDLPAMILDYCSPIIKSTVRYHPAFKKEATDWNAVKEALKMFYGAIDKPHRFTVQDLRKLTADTSSYLRFANERELSTYVRKYYRIASQLLENKLITENEMKIQFAIGLPTTTREKVFTLLPDDNKTESNPPTLETVIKLVKNLVDPTRLENLVPEGLGEDHQGDRFQADEDIDYTTTIIEKPATKTILKKVDFFTPQDSQTHSQPKTEMELLTEQLRELKIQLAESMNGRQSTSTNSSQNRPARCFMCGKENPEHRGTPRSCPETPRLMDEQLVRINEHGRYVQMNGEDLPRTSDPQGVAGHLRRTAALMKESQINPHASTSRSASAVSVQIDGDEVFGDRQSFNALSDLNAVTRSGKDSNRFDPVDKGKRPVRDGIRVPDGTSTQPRQTGPPIAQKIVPPQYPPSNVPPPPSINREDGYKNSIPSRRKDEDVKMKDNSKDTSDLQNLVDMEAVQKKVLSAPLTLSVQEVIGISPMLQKRVQDLTRSRREYVNKAGEFELYTEHAEEFLRDHDDESHLISPESALNAAIGSGDVPDFLDRYANAISFSVVRYYAMACGTFKARIGEEIVNVLVDTGSELNLIYSRVAERAALPNDHDGARWSLKGLGGGPDQLRGCANNVDLDIGGHIFTHHLFLAGSQLGKHDIILGQPWLQWFAASIDYNRKGGMMMRVWKEGDRSRPPTLSIPLLGPNNERNVDRLNPNTEFKNDHNHAGDSRQAYREYQSFP